MTVCEDGGSGGCEGRREAVSERRGSGVCVERSSGKCKGESGGVQMHKISTSLIGLLLLSCYKSWPVIGTPKSWAAARAV